MSNLVNYGSFDLEPTTCSTSGGLVSSVLSTLLQVATGPATERQRMQLKAEIMKKAIDANQKTREDIMRTIRELGLAGNLTPEVMQYLFTFYGQALVQLPL